MDPLTPRGKGTGEGRATLRNEGPILMTPGGSFIDAKTSQLYFAYNSGSTSNAGAATTSSTLNSPAASARLEGGTVFDSVAGAAGSNTSSATKAPQPSSSSSSSSLRLPAGWEMRDLFGGAMVCALPTSFEDVSVVRQVPDHQEVFVDKETELSLIVELLSADAPPVSGAAQVPGVDNGSGSASGSCSSSGVGYLSDDKAAAFYFEDLSQCNEAVESRVESSEIIPACNSSSSSSSISNSGSNGGGSGTGSSTAEPGLCDFMPHVPRQYTRCALVGRQIVSKFNSNNPSRPKDAVQILLLVLRLPEVRTDVLITLNVPYAQLPAQAASGAAAAQLQKPVLLSNSLAPADVMKMVLHTFKIVDYSLFA